MENKRLASLSLSKEALDRTPQEVIELLLRLLSRVNELESRLNKHSGNSDSDKPLSDDSPFRQVREEKATWISVRKRTGVRQKLLSPTETTLLLPQFCSCGGVRFKGAEPFYTHQVLELPKIDPHVEHIVLHRARDADCGRLAKADLPLEKKTGKRLRWLWVMGADAAARLMRMFKLYQDRKDEAGTLVRHLMRELDSFWTFLREPGVFVTNNHAERLLRFPVMWRKRSFGTRTREGGEFVERLFSFRQTCHLQGKRAYPYLVETFERPLSGRKPRILFFNARGSRCSVTSARSLHTLLNSTYSLLLTQSWQPSAKTAFCRFSSMTIGYNFLSHRECNAL